ncbi:uncharacterized protein LOC127030110 [Gopherus flavomarginatus]|uniref:uncharacterized protein LOC127030110 n=1 Tax=Gopherus flavomarginatus TaxID=286002 RepID=UPI0021CBC965|nr:uncharacterized protein LOC127030110 [Gopherus flavomarginatus]
MLIPDTLRQCNWHGDGATFLNSTGRALQNLSTRLFIIQNTRNRRSHSDFFTSETMYSFEAKGFSTGKVPAVCFKGDPKRYHSSDGNIGGKGADAASIWVQIWSLCSMMPAELILEWHGKVAYHGGQNKAALPRNLLQRIAEYLHESVLEISINSLFLRAPSAPLEWPPIPTTPTFLASRSTTNWSSEGKGSMDKNSSWLSGRMDPPLACLTFSSSSSLSMSSSLLLRVAQGS